MYKVKTWIRRSNNYGGNLYAGAARFIFVQKITGYDVINYHANTGYAESRVIPTSKFEKYWSNGDESDGPVDNLFDENDGDDSYWESSLPSSNTPCPSVFVNFFRPLKLDELLLGAYKGALWHHNYGFPKKLNVYTSNSNDEELKLVATFKGSPGDSKIYQFSFREPIVCSRIQLEFAEAPDHPCLNFLKFVGEMIDFSTGDLQDDFITQHVNNSYPLYGINDTNFVVNDLPIDDDYLFIVEKQFYFNNVSFTCPDALMSAIKGNHSNKVTIKQCEFNACSVKNKDGNGGAILSLNCVLKCDDSQFTSYKSKVNGGGGGIYIALNEKINEDILIRNCVFKKCSATFGAALFLYSNVLTNSINIEKCTFESNSLIDSSSSDSLFGGSAVYLNAQKAVIKRCKFALNIGDSSCKIDNNFDNVPAQLLNGIGFDSNIIIDNCQFEIDQSAKSSISYVHGFKMAVNTVVSNCIFTGNLLNGAHHISVDSKSKQNEKQKLSIESCKFACDKVKSINLNLDDLFNSLVVFNLNNQVFDYDENDDVHKSNSKSLFIAAVSLVAVAVAALIAVIVSKKIIFDDDNEKNDTLNYPLDDNIKINGDSSAFV